MRGIDLIVSDPRMGDYAACIGGTRLEAGKILASVAFVLGDLAKGLSVQQVVDLYEGDLLTDEVCAAIAYGAVLARDEQLPPAAAAGFAERLPAGISLQDVIAHAEPVLGELAAGAPREGLLARDPALSEELIAAVLRYAESLARNDRLAVPAEPPEWTFLRDMLSEPDRTLVEDFRLYWSETRGPGIPERQLDGWRRVVENLERDRYFTEDRSEYECDLRVRDDLEEWLTVLSPTNKERWLELVMELDKRFDSATRHVSKPLRGPETKPRRWWWYRVPRRLASRSGAPWS